MRRGALPATNRHNRFTSAARKHGSKRDRIRQVIEHCGRVLRVPPPSDTHMAASNRMLYLGDDAKGVPLDVMTVELPGQALLVIHAMRLRAKRMTDDMYAR